LGKHKQSNIPAGKKKQPGKTATLKSPKSNQPANFFDVLNKQTLLISILAASMLLIAILVVWLKPKIESDLYMAIAGGRDVFNGLLGKPDDWSFTTNGRIWINQNWGADALFYIAYQLFGFRSFIIIKILLISLTAFLMILASKKRGAPLSLTMIVISAALISASFFYSIRASLFTFVFIPLILWLLYSSPKNPKLIYPAALIVGVWANMHGGYIFGLLMIFLWAGCMILRQIISGGWKNIGQYWHFVVGALLTLLITVFCNPFGIENLKMSMIMASNTQFQNITEWQPVWKYKLILNIYTFFITLSIPLVLIILRHVCADKANKIHKAKREKPLAAVILKHQDIGLILFDILLIAIGTILALKSQRIYPIALLAAAPLVSLLMSWLITKFRMYWLHIVLIIVVLCLAGSELLGFTDAYKANHPLWENGSWYKKMSMVYENNFPVALTTFINDNQISGNAFSCWTWDGYLRWYCPQIKVFIGGRAQQIHDEETLKKSLDFENGRLPITALSNENAHIVLGTIINNNYQRIFGEFIRTANWVVIYFDGTNYLAIDSTWPPAKDIIAKATNNQLVFRDKTTENMSAVCTSISLTKGINPAVLFNRMTEAVKRRYESWCYEMLGKLLNNGPNDIKVVNFLENELRRTEKANIYHTPRGINILSCRGTIAAILKEYYIKQRNNERAQVLANMEEADLNSIETLYSKNKKIVNE
jgi:hypothetical protein